VEGLHEAMGARSAKRVGLGEISGQADGKRLKLRPADTQPVHLVELANQLILTHIEARPPPAHHGPRGFGWINQQESIHNSRFVHFYGGFTELTASWV
jgi:hypothetical protein